MDVVDDEVLARLNDLRRRLAEPTKARVTWEDVRVVLTALGDTMRERDRLRDALIAIRGHTRLDAAPPYKLVAELLTSIERITDTALTPEA